jgi:hypothetical protein
MPSISESVILELIKNLVLSGLGRYLGIDLANSHPSQKGKGSAIAGVLGVGTRSVNHTYKIQEFKSEIQDLTDFKLGLAKLLRKKKSPYDLNTLFGLSSKIIIQLSQDVNKGSIIFVDKGQKLLYSLILIGMDLQSIKDDLFFLASGGSK